MATMTSDKDETRSALNQAKDEVRGGAEQVAASAKSAARTVRSEAGSLESSLTRSAEDLAASVTDTLRSAGVDTDKMVEVAREQATDLQRMIVQEIQDRPLRALGVAAAIGLFVGFLSAR